METVAGRLWQSPASVSTIVMTTAVVPSTLVGRVAAENVIAFVPCPEVISPFEIAHW